MEIDISEIKIEQIDDNQKCIQISGRIDSDIIQTFKIASCYSSTFDEYDCIACILGEFSEAIKKAKYKIDRSGINENGKIYHLK